MERVRKLLLAKGYDAAAIKAMEKSVKKEVDTAVEEGKVRAAIMRRAAATMRCCDSKYCPAVLGGCYAHGVAASIGTPAAFMQAVTHRGLVTLVLPTCAQRDVQACQSMQCSAPPYTLFLILTMLRLRVCRLPPPLPTSGCGGTCMWLQQTWTCAPWRAPTCSQHTTQPTPAEAAAEPRVLKRLLC